ncbi:MAG: HEAT repeat domain-containing protein [Cyclobacteriaceae bacterium]
MKARLLRFLDVETDEVERVVLLLIMGFFMGMFMATISVASQSLFLEHFSETEDLPVAFVVSGLFGLIATLVYNFLQNRIPFPLLATVSLLTVAGITAFIEFGEDFFANPNDMYAFGFTQILPFTFIVYLVFWGSFGRLFNLRQAKRLVGTVDIGAMMATFIAFFSIPLLFTLEIIDGPQNLYALGLLSIIIFIALFAYLSVKHLNKIITFAQEKVLYKKLAINDFIHNRYILYMSLFIIFAMMAMTFVNYSFLNVTTLYLDTKSLANFISLFEGTIVVFCFLFQVLATDKIQSMYGMRVSLLINPVLIGSFTVAALVLGFIFGYAPANTYFVVFFLTIAMSKLLISSVKESLDNPTFKLYLLPIESKIRIDVQTKIEGIVTAVASIIAGGFIILITQSGFNLIYITMFAIPLIALWYFVVNKMHDSYRHTLQNTLIKNKETTEVTVKKQFTIHEVLENQVRSSVEERVIYGLKLMEKLEPTLFENAVMSLTESDNRRIRKFAEEKVQELGVTKDPAHRDLRDLAQQAASDTEDSDLLSISPEKLMKLSKSPKQQDRILAAKLLRKLISQKTIFILLELLRDADPKVRFEALQTARKTRRVETWPVLIEMLSSPLYSHHAAAALKGAGDRVLTTLEAAFHKSGQSDLVMLRIVQIMGQIGGDQALQLLWRKADYPDKRIVKQILYSLRYINYRAQGREARDVMSLLETEISKTMWNLAAVEELPKIPDFEFLRQALREEIAQNYDQITMLLSILYDPQSVELVRENIESGDPDNIAFAMELLDLFVDQELKPKLLPLLDDSSPENKLRALQLFYPRENYTPIQVINYVLNRDFNLNNRWTKVCAIHAAAFMPDFRISRGLIAQVFNSDRLLQETAAWVVYNKDKKLFAEIRERLPQQDRKFLDSSIENNQLLDGLDDGFFLEIEMVMFIKQLPVFENIHGSLICDLADKIAPVELKMGEKIKLASQDDRKLILIVAHGEVKLLEEDRIVKVMKKGGVYGELLHEGPSLGATDVVATERTILFKISLLDFYFVMANHHDLVQGLIKNITEQKEEHTLPN